jgi:hypothetical protein
MTNDESLALNPDGKISYLEKNNPYRTQSTQTQFDEDNVNILHNEHVRYMTLEIYETADKLQRYACFIRFVAFIDFIMTMFNLTLEYPYALAVACISLCGYFGATQYNKKLLRIYMFYQWIKIFLKSTYLYYVINQNISILLIASGIYDGYIVYVTRKFIHLIPSPDETSAQL